MGEIRNTYKVVARKNEGRSQFWRPSRRWNLRRIFGPNRDEVTGELRTLHNEELHILQSFPNIIRQIKSRRMRWVGHVACMGEERKVYRVLVGKPEGKSPLGRPRRR
jgi:hypothetical protein